MLTNHHVAFGAIQQNSSVDADHIKKGYVAKTHADELACPGFTAHVTLSVREITQELANAENVERALRALVLGPGRGALDEQRKHPVCGGSGRR